MLTNSGGNDDTNIRNMINHGLDGVIFADQPLRRTCQD
ncbi:hypothetical protein ACQPXM_25070 [Kribbella sp. CA-253562]